MQTGVQGFAFIDHAEDRNELEPLWPGLIIWAVIVLTLVVLD